MKNRIGIIGVVVFITVIAILVDVFVNSYFAPAVYVLASGVGVILMIKLVKIEAEQGKHVDNYMMEGMVAGLFINMFFDMFFEFTTFVSTIRSITVLIICPFVGFMITKNKKA